MDAQEISPTPECNKKVDLLCLVTVKEEFFTPASLEALQMYIPKALSPSIFILYFFPVATSLVSLYHLYEGIGIPSTGQSKTSVSPTFKGLLALLVFFTAITEMRNHVTA